MHIFLVLVTLGYFTLNLVKIKKNMSLYGLIDDLFKISKSFFCRVKKFSQYVIGFLPFL